MLFRILGKIQLETWMNLYLGRAWPKKEVTESWERSGSSFVYKYSLIFKGPIFNVFSMILVFWYILPQKLDDLHEMLMHMYVVLALPKVEVLPKILPVQLNRQMGVYDPITYLSMYCADIF